MVICFIMGYVPTVGTELILIGVGAVTKRHLLLIALVGSVAQTVSKVHIYFISQSLVKYLSYKKKKRLVQIRKKLKNKSLVQWTIGVSSLTGLPPYYLVNIASGIIDTGWFAFMVLGLVGMFIRFYCCLLFPQVFLSIFN